MRHLGQVLRHPVFRVRTIAHRVSRVVRGGVCPNDTYPAARLCQSFKHNLETRTVPLIVVSCCAKACEEALAQGADDFATPQTLPALLLRRIEALVHVRQARKILCLEDEGAREPRFPPLQWRDHVSSPRRAIALDPN